MTIAAERDCTWTIASDANWLSVDGHSGQGEATVRYAVGQNETPVARRGTVTVASHQLAIAQEGAPCRFELDRPATEIAAEGGTVGIGVSVLTGCRWTAASRASWIGVGPGVSGNGSARVVLDIAPNPGATRTGQVAIADQLFTVQQLAPPPPPPPTPTPAPPAPTPAPPAPAPSPGPAPTPSPGPTPTPPPGPTPPPSQSVTFSGFLTGLSGSCPNVSFRVNGRTITTNRETEYAKKDSCSDIRNGRRVEGTGRTQPNGSVLAATIDVTSDNNNDD